MSETIEVLTTVTTSETVEVLSSATTIDITEFPVTVTLSNDPGPQGPAGAGVPQGGDAGQVLAKVSGTDFDTDWVPLPTPPVTSVDGRTGAVTLADLYDAAGSAAAAQAAAEGYADGLAVNYDAAGSASTAETNAKDYADGLAVNYDPAGAAASAQSAAESYADGLAVNYDPAGSASTAETNAKDYADGLAVNYDAAGSAASAQSAAEGYADSLAVNYDPAGSASAAETNAKDYADGLAVNYDPAGSASTAENNAKNYADDNFVPYGYVGANNGVAQLDNDGKVPSNQLPAIAITDTFVVASQSAMLALTAEVGDVAVRTDLSKSFILTATPASTLGNWQELLTPPDTVTSVNSKTGAVTLSYTDVGADPAGAAAAVTLSGLGGVPTSRTVNGKALSSDVTLSYSDVGADAAGAAAAVTTTSIGAVPTTRTVNGKALSADISLTAADVGADPAGSAAAVTTTSIGAVPTSRTVNGYALSANVSLTASDVGADAAGTAATKVASVGGTSPITTTGTTAVTVAINDASTSAKGAVQLEDSTSSTSTSKAATPNSVKSAYDLAAGKVASVAGTAPITTTGTTAITVAIADASMTGKGAVQLTDSTSSTSTTTAATPNAVKSAYDLANGKPSLGSATPLVAGTAAAGTAAAASHEDHVHPTDTTRAAALDEVIPTDPTGAYFDGTGMWCNLAASNYASTPDAAPLRITGDIDVQVKLKLADWTPAAAVFVVGKYGSGTTRGWNLQVATDGKLWFVWTPDGTFANRIEKTSTVATGITDGSTKWIRATLDVDNGSSNYDLKFWTSDDGSSWTQLGATVNGSAITSIYASTDLFTIGTVAASTVSYNGTIYRAIVKNGIGGTTVFDADFSAVPADSFAFTESSSNAATVTLTTTRYQFGVPSLSLTSSATSVLTANRTYYTPFFVRGKSITVKHLAVDVTTAPATNATMRLAIYAADSSMQPTGAPLYNSGAVTVSSSGAAIYRIRVTPTTLSAGNYVLAFNIGTAFTIRFWYSTFSQLPNTMGSNLITTYYVSETLSGDFANPGTKWNVRGTGTTNLINFAFMSWS